MRGVSDFDDLAGYRRFIDEIVSRKNAHHAKRIEAERPAFRRCRVNGPATTRRRSSPLLLRAGSPSGRCSTRCRRASSATGCGSGSTMTASMCSSVARALMTLTRGRAHQRRGKHAHVVDYRHVIHALRRKPMALLNLVYRDQLFPRDAYRPTFDRLLEKLPEKSACRLMVDLLALAHDRGCEAELAIGPHRRPRRRPAARSGRVAHALCPDPAALPEVVVHLAPLVDYDAAARRRHGRGGMTQAPNRSIDAARLTLILNDLRLPAIKQDWPAFAERADKESWPAARLLAALAEHEIAERDRRRLARHLVEAQLLPGKTLDSFDFDAVPMISKAHVLAICAGDSWIEKGANLLLIGGPGGGKTHLASAIGLALVENGLARSVRPHVRPGAEAPGRAPRTGPRSRHQPARPLPPADPRRPRLCQQGPGGNLRPVRADQCPLRTAVDLITANQPFGAWGKVFPDPAMTLAAVDRLVHHATIFEINVDSYRRRAALDRKNKGAGRPQAYATIKDLEAVSRTRQSNTNLTLARDNHGAHHAHAAITVSHPDRRKFSSRLSRNRSTSPSQSRCIGSRRDRRPRRIRGTGSFCG